MDDLTFIKKIFKKLFSIGAVCNGGVTRLGYTAEEDAMHGEFARVAEELGARVWTDQAGNSFAAGPALSGEERPWLVASHLDSVKEGGRYDGVAGVLAGLLMLRWARDAEGKGGRHKIPLMVGAFRCEESSRFGLATVGSGLVTGKYQGPLFVSSAGGEYKPLDHEIAARGLSLTPPAIRPLRGYLELHIEQGRVLQDYGDRLGVVTAIAGYRRFIVTLCGRADHSGATPMDLRRDSLAAAAELILKVEELGREEAARHSVATVTEIRMRPNVTNVIPRKTRLLVDTRGVDDASLEAMEGRLREVCRALEDRRKVSVQVENIPPAKPVALSAGLADRLLAAAREEGFSSRLMVSGAGHDAMCFPGLCDTGLLFIPCRNGASHSRLERARLEDICDGARVLYRVVTSEV